LASQKNSSIGQSLNLGRGCLSLLLLFKLTQGNPNGNMVAGHVLLSDPDLHLSIFE